MEGLFGAVSILDQCDVGSDFIGQIFGDGLAFLCVKLVVVELEVHLADVDLVVVQKSELVYAVGYF